MPRIIVGWTGTKANSVPIPMVFHPEDPKCVVDPNDPTKWLTGVQHIARLNADVNLRTQAGWNDSSQHPTESSPKTHWQRLVEHTNSPEGHPELKALNLK